MRTKIGPYKEVISGKDRIKNFFRWRKFLNEKHGYINFIWRFLDALSNSKYFWLDETKN